MDCNFSPPCLRDRSAECMCFMNGATGDQTCGYLGRDGNTIHSCSPTCCNGGLGCPGQCKGVAPRRPDATYNGDTVNFHNIYNVGERKGIVNIILNFLLLLAVVSTLSLFIHT